MSRMRSFGIGTVSYYIRQCVHCAMNFYELMSRGYTKNRNCFYREYGPQL